MKCADCNQTIEPSERTAIGPDGVIHFDCFKRGTAHGRPITLASLSKEIGQLKKRVQNLEETVKMHDRNIDFRIGG